MFQVAAFRRARWLTPAAALVLVCAAQAQSETIVVTATRTPLRVTDAVAEVTVIDRAAIERAEGRTLVELLAQQPGLQASGNGGLGKTSSVFIRGLEARHTLLLVDGVKVYSATVGTPSLDNLPLEAIDRIEIVRGPMSSLYGNGAMGGVIQVFTRRGTQGLSANAKVAAGSHDFGQVAAGAGYGNGSIDIAAQLQRTDAQGISVSNPKVPFGQYNPDADPFRQTGGSLRLGWQPLTDWRVELLGLQSRGITGVDDGPGGDARARLENRVTALSATGRVLPAWRTKFSASESVDVYDTLSSASPFSSLGAIQTRIEQLAWENTVETPAGSLLALAESAQESASRPGQPFDVSQRRITGVALGLSGAAAGHAWQASLRRDQNSQFGGATTGALGWGWAFVPAFRLGASLGTSFVAPSFNQLYYPNFGNPLLRPETGRHGELSLRWTGEAQSLRAAAYANRYRGFITSGAQPINLPYADIRGVTATWDGRFRGLDLSASYDHTSPRNTTEGNANNGRLLPRRAQNALRLGADTQLDTWSAGATLAAFSQRFDDAGNTAPLGGYATLDLRADWRLSRELTLGLHLNNLADKRYETTLGYNQPGREAFVSLRWKLR